MSVIKQDVNLAAAQLLGTCNNCFEQVDFSPIQSTRSQDPSDGMLYATGCANCGQYIYVNKASGYNGQLG